MEATCTELKNRNNKNNKKKKLKNKGKRKKKRNQLWQKEGHYQCQSFVQWQVLNRLRGCVCRGERWVLVQDRQHHANTR